jgi:hypothetical protein
MMERNLKCLGVGDGAACGDRNHSSYLYQLDDTWVLLDCGEPVSRSFKASGLSYDTIDRIVLSHTHSDHIGGFFMLLQGFWLEKRRKPLTVHLPEDAIQPLQQMMTTAYLFREMLTFELTFEPLQARRPVACGAWTITPYRTTHLDGFRKNFRGKYPGNYDAFCFALEGDGCRIGHSADLGGVEDLAPLLAHPLELLVCELAHFRAEVLFEYLQGRAIRHVVFTHLDRRYWENLVQTRELAAKLLPGARLTFAHDQETVAF